MVDSILLSLPVLARKTEEVLDKSFYSKKYNQSNFMSHPYIISNCIKSINRFRIMMKIKWTEKRI